ncbi:MAG: CAP domain-containing protein [Bacillota bacterium]
MRTLRKSLLTGFLAVLLTLCLAAAAFAGSDAPEIRGAQSPDTVLQQSGIVNEAVDKVIDPVAESPSSASAGEDPGDNNDAEKGEKAPSDQVKLGQALSEQGQPLQGGAIAAESPVLGVESVVLTSEEDQMLSLVNRERAASGLAPLKSDSSLVKLARLKAQDMINNRYFDHISPTYGSPFEMMKKFGISYTYAGENLAMAPSVASAHKALMESPGHRANILKENYDRVGIGIVVTGGYRYCVQMFTGGQREIPSSGGGTGGSGGNSTQPQPSQPPQEPSQPQTPPGQPTDGSTGLSAEESLFVDLINQERVKAGLNKLNPDAQLFKVARLKALDFVENNYFAHTSLIYGTYREMLSRFGVKFVNAGENLAASTSADRAHKALMASSGNKANILSAKYQRIGIGIAVKGNYKYFVEMFTDGVVQEPPAGGTPQPPAPDPPKLPVTNPGTQPGSGSTAGLTADEQRMLSLVNSERAKMGLSPLTANLRLTGVARLKAKDMIANNYFSHTSPTYGSPFEMMRQFGITYSYAGENLAGAPTVDSAHTNLMNSPGHRANILNANYKEVGIGIINGGPYGKMFVQMFIGR